MSDIRKFAKEILIRLNAGTFNQIVAAKNKTSRLAQERLADALGCQTLREEIFSAVATCHEMSPHYQVAISLVVRGFLVVPLRKSANL